MQNEEKVFQDKSTCTIPHPFINNIINKIWGNLLLADGMGDMHKKIKKPYDTYTESSIPFFCVCFPAL